MSISLDPGQIYSTSPGQFFVCLLLKLLVHDKKGSSRRKRKKEKKKKKKKKKKKLAYKHFYCAHQSPARQ